MYLKKKLLRERLVQDAIIRKTEAVIDVGWIETLRKFSSTGDPFACHGIQQNAAAGTCWTGAPLET